MAIEQPLTIAPGAAPGLATTARHEVLTFETREELQLIDITDAVIEACTHAGVSHGTVTVQSRHTTAAIVIQENEPLLLEDLKRLLGRLAPKKDHYCHNDISARSEVPPDERPNGHSHARALLLPSSAQLVVADGDPVLGRWQRIFLVELDGPRRRSTSVMTLGITGSEPAAIHLVTDRRMTDRDEEAS